MLETQRGDVPIRDIPPLAFLYVPAHDRNVLPGTPAQISSPSSSMMRG